MKFHKNLPALLLAVALLSGCDNKSAAPTAPSARVQWEPTEAQPRLTTKDLWIGPAAIFSDVANPANRDQLRADPDVRMITAELALKPKEIMTGMMFRTNVVEEEGMLFRLGYPQQASFWMKNCPKPLSCAYIDPQGVILEIREMEPNNTNSIVANSGNVLFVLETARGWFERHGVRTGMVVQTESGPLANTIQRSLVR